MTYEEAVEIILEGLPSSPDFNQEVLDTVRAHVWLEGARAGWASSTDAGFNSESYTFDEAGIDAQNPYLED